MATLFDLAQAYLNRALPETFRYGPTTPPTPPPITDSPQDPNAPVKRILPVQGGGDGFSVYNPDPNRTRDKSNYSPYAYRQAAERSYIGAPGDYSYSSETEAQKMMDMYPEYYRGKQLTGIPGAIAAYAKNSLPGRIIGGVANFAKDMLPVNSRAKLENELLGSGIMLDDIGRVVSNDYNTAEGIMAGYNAAKVTDKTFDKRRETIQKTIDRKKAKGLDTTVLENRLELLDESQDLFSGARTRTKDILKEEYKQDPKYQFTGPNVQGDFKSIVDTKSKKTITDRGRGQSNVGTKSKTKTTPKGGGSDYGQFNRRQQNKTTPGPKPGSSNPRRSGGPGDRGRGQSNVGTKSKGSVSTKGQAGPPSQRGGGGGGGGGGGCFLKGTLITMFDGTKKPVEQVDLGNQVAIGGKVFATGKFLVKNLHDYKGIKVSGSHMVSENNKWVRVEDSEHGKLLGNEEHTVYVFGSENRRILINDILFTDYFEVNEQDKLINNEEDFFDNWKLYAKQDSGNNVDIINAS